MAPRENNLGWKVNPGDSGSSDLESAKKTKLSVCRAESLSCQDFSCCDTISTRASCLLSSFPTLNLVYSCLSQLSCLASSGITASQSAYVWRLSDLKHLS